MRLRQKLTLMLITLLCTLQSHGMNPEQEKINIKKGNEEKLTFQIDNILLQFPKSEVEMLKSKFRKFTDFKNYSDKDLENYVLKHLAYRTNLSHLKSKENIQISDDQEIFSIPHDYDLNRLYFYDEHKYCTLYGEMKNNNVICSLIVYDQGSVNRIEVEENVRSCAWDRYGKKLVMLSPVVDKTKRKIISTKFMIYSLLDKKITDEFTVPHISLSCVFNNNNIVFLCYSSEDNEDFKSYFYEYDLEKQVSNIKYQAKNKKIMNLNYKNDLICFTEQLSDERGIVDSDGVDLIIMNLNNFVRRNVLNWNPREIFRDNFVFNHTGNKIIFTSLNRKPKKRNKPMMELLDLNTRKISTLTAGEIFPTFVTADTILVKKNVTVLNVGGGYTNNERLIKCALPGIK